MKRIGLVLPLIFLTGALSFAASAEEYDFDLSKMSAEDLNNFESDVDSAIKQYHKLTSKEESAVLDAVKDEVEEYFSEGKVSWPWFDYSYTKDWDFYTVTTHMDYKVGDESSEKYDIYGELYYDNGYVIYFLEAGHDRIIDLQDSIPQGQWMNTPDSLINSITGLDLSLLGKDELNKLKNEIDDEISANHTTNSTTNNIVRSLVKDQVEKKYNEPNWPWINYSYTNDWGFYTLTTSVNYKDAKDEKQKANVYAEAYPTDGDYELYYLAVGDDVLVDKREELPADLSDPDAIENSEENNELTEISEIIETETEAIETQEPETKESETEELETEETETKEQETEKQETEEQETETEKPETEEQETEESDIETETFAETEILTEEDRTVYAPDTVLTGMIIEATMNTITVQTEDGSTYICATEGAKFDLISGGIMLGMEVEVVLESTTSNEYGLFTAEAVTEIKETEEETEIEEEIETEKETEAQTEQVTESPAAPEEEDAVLYENGARGDEVREVQEKLIELGYLSGTADGIFGGMTEEALRAFQEENGLEPSGAITEKTMEALDIKNEQDGDPSFDLAFIDPGKVESTYFMFDTNSKKAIYFDSIDGLVMETVYTGELSEGVALDWSAYNGGEEWTEYFTYKDGSNTGTFKGIDGYVGDYEVCDLDEAMEVLNTKPGYGSENNSQTKAAEEKAEEDEKETQAKETTAAASGSDEDEYAGGRYEGWAITSLKNMAEAVYPYGVKFHSLAAESTTRYEGNGIWYVKQKVDITNEYGAKRSTCLECRVDFINNTVTDFKETK